MSDQQAFPCAVAVQPNGEHVEGPDGMSLRDWFAGQALQGSLATNAEDYDRAARGHAEFAYQVADEMMAVRADADVVSTLDHMADLIRPYAYQDGMMGVKCTQVLSAINEAIATLEGLE